MRTFRFLLLTFAGAALGGLALVEAWHAIETGVVSVPMGRRRWGFVFTFVRGQDVLGYPAGVTFLVAVGALLLAGVLWQLRTVLHGDDRQRERMIDAAIAEVERAAPSGLAPLWLGLIVAATCLVIYAAA